MKTRYKLLAAGVGMWAILDILRKAESAVPPRPALNGFEPLMEGYDPAAEAIGCACGGTFDDGMGDVGGLGFFKKIKKRFKKDVKKVTKMTVKKPVSLVKRDFKKGGSLVKRDFKKAGGLVKRDFTKAAGLVKRDFTKAAKLMRTDFSRAGAMFKRKKKSKGGGSVGPTEYKYYDENGVEITKAQYDAAMAQYAAEYGGMTPGNGAQADGFTDESPTFSTDETAAQFFESQEDTGRDANTLVYDEAQSLFTGGEDMTAPEYMVQENWYDAAQLPEDIVEQTMDAYAMDQTSGDSLIMPYGEPSMPYSADEMLVAFEEDGGESRGDSYRPDMSDTGDYMNPGYNESWGDYWGSYDDAWSMDGLGALVARPNPRRKPAQVVLYHRNKRKWGRGLKRYPLQADRTGNVYTRVGGRMYRVGTVDAFAGARGAGKQIFARDMSGEGLGGWGSFKKKFEKKAKNVATYTTPSGFAYSRLKKNKRLHRDFRRNVKVVKPYALIAGGTALTVVTLGAGSAAGVAAIAAGAAELGAQTYSDIQARKAEKNLEKAIERDRLAEAIESNNVIAEAQTLEPSAGPAAGEIPGGDWPNQYPGDGVWADFLDLTDSMA